MERNTINYSRNLLAYGVRNEVGIVEDGAGPLWGVESSADDLTRTVNGTATDVHQGAR